MRLRAALALVVAVALALLLWRTGAFAALGAEAAAWQRAMQNALQRAVMALRAGEPGALAWLMGSAAAYGVAHAAGPGHGKALIAAAAAGTRASARRLAGLAAAGSLAQGAVAVAVVYGALGLAWSLGLRDLARSDATLAPIGHATLVALGLWLGWRGLRGLWTAEPACGCGHHDHHHRHTPPDARLDARFGAALVAAIAARPCGGAMITLAVAWAAGVPVAGALAVLAMSAGVAVVTVASALAAAAAREAALTASGPAFGRVAAGLQACVGAVALLVGAAGLAATL